MYNTTTKKAEVILCNRGEPIGGKYLLDKPTSGLYHINDYSYEHCEWSSVEVDFGSHQEKEITEIGIYISASARFYMYSGTGYISFTLEEGNNYKKVNLKGKKFYFSILTYGDSVLIKDLQIKYKNLGE